MSSDPARQSRHPMYIFLWCDPNNSHLIRRDRSITEYRETTNHSQQTSANLGRPFAPSHSHRPSYQSSQSISHLPSQPHQSLITQNVFLQSAYTCSPHAHHPTQPNLFARPQHIPIRFAPFAARSAFAHRPMSSADHQGDAGKGAGLFKVSRSPISPLLPCRSASCGTCHPDIPAARPVALT